jgi:hypothetical protein
MQAFCVSVGRDALHASITCAKDHIRFPKEATCVPVGRDALHASIFTAQIGMITRSSGFSGSGFIWNVCDISCCYSDYGWSGVAIPGLSKYRQ